MPEIKVIVASPLCRTSPEMIKCWDMMGTLIQVAKHDLGNEMAFSVILTRLNSLTPRTRPVADPAGAARPVLSFVGGQISMRRSGYGAANGSGWFTFDEDDLDVRPHDSRSGSYAVVKMSRSELEDLRDWLTRELAAVVDG